MDDGGAENRATLHEPAVLLGCQRSGFTLVSGNYKTTTDAFQALSDTIRRDCFILHVPEQVVAEFYAYKSRFKAMGAFAKHH